MSLIVGIPTVGYGPAATPLQLENEVTGEQSLDRTSGRSSLVCRARRQTNSDPRVLTASRLVIMATLDKWSDLNERVVPLRRIAMKRHGLLPKVNREADLSDGWRLSGPASSGPYWPPEPDVADLRDHAIRLAGKLPRK